MKEIMAFGQQAFSWTWKTSVQAALLVVLIVLLQKFLERWLTPRLRYALSFLVLCRLLLPAAPASRLSADNLFVRTAEPTATESAHASSPRALMVDLPLGSVGLSERPGFPLVEAFGVVWFCGFLGLLCCGGWRYRRCRRLVRGGERISDPGLLAMLQDAREAMGVSCPVALVSVPQLSSPAVFGFWRVCLLLPETALLNLNHQELRLVFMHEMAHVRRKDSLLNVVLILVQFLHWFNPLVWLGLHRLRTDRELVCDAMVMRRAGEEATDGS
jgi:bla regulator protein BlaR1